LRKEFTNTILPIARADDSLIFVTGDLGFGSFEELRKIMGPRFINAGVAEQSLVGIAAGLAYKGYKVFCYSIAPFIVYRCLEQIRNDVCFHKKPVFLIGNGGGYGYGVQGSTHHAISDVGTLAALPDMTCYVPAFAEDIGFMVNKMIDRNLPAYLRLGLGVKRDNDLRSDDVFFKETTSSNPEWVIAAMGPVAGVVKKAIASIPSVDFYTVRQLPLSKLDPGFTESINKAKKLIVIEEHVETGGLGQTLSNLILKSGLSLNKYHHLCALGYPSGTYGSQTFHLAEAGITEENIRSLITNSQIIS
jgi:transketolase